MIIGKTCFIHYRNTNPFSSETLPHGGVTIAWKVEAETGDIIVGEAAKCHPTDRFQKSAGREIAEKNLNDGKLYFIIPKEVYLSLAKVQAVFSAAFTTLTPSANDKIAEFILSQLEDDIFNFMASNWFEQLVRDRFSFYNNQLEVLVG